MTKKKRQVRLLAAIAALAALGLLYVLVSRADWNGEEDDTAAEEIEALSIAPAEISEAAITSSYGTLRLHYDGEIWTSVDAPSMELNQDALSNMWNRLNPLSAVRDLGEAPENLSAYSLSDPAITIRITRDDSTEISVSIGSTASDGNVYVMTSESDHIYTCDSYLATAFTCQLSDFEVIAEGEETDMTDSAD